MKLTDVPESRFVRTGNCAGCTSSRMICVHCGEPGFEHGEGCGCAFCREAKAGTIWACGKRTGELVLDSRGICGNACFDRTGCRFDKEAREAAAVLEAESESEHRPGDWNDENPDPDPRDEVRREPETDLASLARKAHTLLAAGYPDAAKETLNQALRLVRTLGDVIVLTHVAEDWGHELKAKRMKAGRHNALYAFSGPVVWTKDTYGHLQGAYTHDPDSTRLHYLYDDSVSTGSCDAGNLWRVASF